MIIKLATAIALGSYIGEQLVLQRKNSGAYLPIRAHPAGFAARQNGEIWIGPAHFLLYLSLATLKPIKKLTTPGLT